MKVLLDECVNQRLRPRIVGHEVYTVEYMGWASVKNGALLRLAADGGFDVLVTNDRSIRHQHNPATLPLAVICLNANSNDLEDLLLLLEPLHTALLTVQPRTFVDVTAA